MQMIALIPTRRGSVVHPYWSSGQPSVSSLAPSASMLTTRSSRPRSVTLLDMKGFLAFIALAPPSTSTTS